MSNSKNAYLIREDDDSIKIIITLKRRIAGWVGGNQPAWVALLMLSLFAAAIELIYARYSSTNAKVPFGEIAGYALSISLASIITGILLGFLFGIPRTLSGSSQPQAPIENHDSTKDPTASNTTQPPNLGTNTNLEQISDWLTKMLVGVGLTQIGQIPNGLRTISRELQPGFGSAPGAPVFGGLIIIFFSVCGFLIGYLWTRINLTKAFRTAELDVLAAKVSTIESSNARVADALSDVQTQTDKDAAALSISQKLLDPTSGDPIVSQGEIVDAVKASSSALKVQLFYLARKFRKDRNDDPKRKSEIARVIPLLRALIASDSSDRYHRTHAQLAYALNDQSEPDFAGAVNEITNAIKMRDQRSDTGYRNYELFRSLCNIRLMTLANDESKKAELKANIVSDLKEAAKEDIAKVRDLPPITQWLQEMGLSEQDLVS